MIRNDSDNGMILGFAVGLSITTVTFAFLMWLFKWVFV
jgi:hypothetical protein